MKTEVKPKIKSGFFINEVEIIRIKDAQNEQIKKMSGGVDADFSFEVKYRNGVMASPPSLSDILSEENDGSRSIIRLSMMASAPGNADTKIEVQFSDVANDINSGDAAISYEVLSNDKDWTFVSSSVIEERINKIKVNSIVNILYSGRFSSIFPLAIPMIFMIYTLFRESSESVSRLEKIHYIKNTARDLADYIYKVDVMTASRSKDIQLMPMLLVASFAVAIIFGYSAKYISRWYPMYTFYWGDNIKKYDSKLSLMKFVLVGIVMAIIIGVSVNYIYDVIL